MQAMLPSSVSSPHFDFPGQAHVATMGNFKFFLANNQVTDEANTVAIMIWYFPGSRGQPGTQLQPLTRQTNSGRSPAVGCGCLPAVCARPGGLVAGSLGEAGAVGPAVLAGAPGQGSPTAGGPASSIVRGFPTAPGKPCKCRSSWPSNTTDPGPAASARKSHRSTLPTRRCSYWGNTERERG